MPERLRLVVIASTFPGQPGDGTPEFVRDLSSRLSQDFETTVLVPRVPGAARQERIGDILVERFAYFPRRWESLADGAIIENLRSKRSRWLQVPPFMLAEAWHLRRLVRRHKPHVLHVHWIVPQGLVALITGRRVPWVVTTLGGDLYTLNGTISRRLKGAVLRRARAVTTMNADMRDRVVALGADPDTTYVQSLGADVTHQRELNGSVEQIPGRLLFVGRLVEKKGAAVLLEAVRKLSGNTSWSLEVIGDGPLREQLIDQAAGLPVTFPGPASRTELAQAYARSAVVVVPSVPASSGDQDGLPTVLLEAMGSARAIVASDLPGINEALSHDETGLLVPPNDPGALAGAVLQILDDAALRDRLGANAARRSLDYSVDACGRRYAEILTAAATEEHTP